MGRAPISIDALLTHGNAHEAANDAAIDESGPAPGWDPFEVWRTRVKDARERDPTDGGENPG
jgi:hypothetical protein